MDMQELLLLAFVRRACRTGEARRIREAAGISRSEVAGVLGVDSTSVLKWEAGERVPRTALGLRYGELLEGLRDVDSLLVTA